MRKSLRLASALLATACLAPSMASAAPVLGGGVIVAADGNVTARFLGSDAGYSSLLSLVSPVEILNIFHNHDTPVDTTFDLGFFTAGTELVFRIEVLNTAQQFFTGPGSRNFDGVPHAAVDNIGGGETYVGFEDVSIFENPDNDYNDLNFSFTNTAVPEPASALLALGAVAGMLVRRNRRSA